MLEETPRAKRRRIRRGQTLGQKIRSDGKQVFVLLAIGFVILVVSDFITKRDIDISFRITALLLIGAITVFNLALYVWPFIRNTVKGKPLIRHRESASSFLAGQVFLAVILSALLVGDPETQLLIGFSEDFDALIAIAIGLATYAITLFIFNAGAHLLGVTDSLNFAAGRVMHYLRPRRKADYWRFYTGLCLLNPFVEEIVYRGILVSLLAYAVDNVFLAIAVGLTASIAAHLYQGWVLMPFHLLFHGTAIALLFSPGGLISCIAFHVAGDVVPVAKNVYRSRRRLRQLREHRQSR